MKNLTYYQGQLCKALTRTENANRELAELLNEMLSDENAQGIAADVQYALNSDIHHTDRLITGLLEVIDEQEACYV